MRPPDTDPNDVESVVYPFLGWEEETRLFERNLANEREFLDDSDAPRDRRRDQGRARASAGPDRGRSPACAIPTSGWTKGLPRRWPTAFSPTKASCRATSPSAARSNGAATRRRSTASGTRSSNRRWQNSDSAAKLKRVEHHASHAANAYYTSGFDEALIVTLDGYGSGLAGSISIGRGGKIERVHGAGVSAFARHVLRDGDLGARLQAEPARRARSSAWPRTAIRRSCATCCCRDSIQETATSASSRSTTSTSARLLATQFPKIDVAAAYQHVLERVACDYVGALHAEDRAQEPGAVGGVVANVKLNQRLQEIRRRRRASSFIRTWATAAAAPARRCSSSPAAHAERCRADRRRVPRPVVHAPTRLPRRSNRAQLPFTQYTPIEPKIAALHRRRQGGGAVRRPDGIRPARARQPVDPVSRQGAGGEPVAESAARPHGVHAVRAGDAVRASPRVLPATSTAANTPRSS